MILIVLNNQPGAEQFQSKESKEGAVLIKK